METFNAVLDAGVVGKTAGVFVTIGRLCFLWDEKMEEAECCRWYLRLGLLVGIEWSWCCRRICRNGICFRMSGWYYEVWCIFIVALEFIKIDLKPISRPHGSNLIHDKVKTGSNPNIHHFKMWYIHLAVFVIRMLLFFNLGLSYFFQNFKI